MTPSTLSSIFPCYSLYSDEPSAAERLAAAQQPAQQPIRIPVQQPIQQPAKQQARPAQLSAQPQPAQQPVQQTQQITPEQANQPQVQAQDFSQESQQQYAPRQPEPSTSPYVDIFDNPEEITVIADLPGCDEDDITLEGTDQTLRISANHPMGEGEDEDRSIQRAAAAF